MIEINNETKPITMKKNVLLFVYFLVFISFQSCLKSDLPSDFDPSLEIDSKDLQFQSENFGNPTTGNFFGIIKDVNNQILEGVQIQIGNAMTVTDRNGAFVMNNVDVYENFAYIQATKNGYLKGSRTVIPKENGSNRILIKLYKNEPIATVNSGEASEVSIPSGPTIKFSGDFIRSDGNPYTGSVNVVANYIRPNNQDTFVNAPGSLFAQTESNSARSLETYGMVSVTLFSPSGEELNIDENSPTTIEFPVDFSQTGIAPEAMSLWYFDEEVGYWKEDGQATKQGNIYVAEVNHFTWWNCDLPIDYVEFCFNIIPTNLDGTTQYSVAIQRVLNDQYIFYGSVSSGEVECGLIPKDEEIKIYVFNQGVNCNSSVLFENVVGGFSTDTSMNINITDPNQHTLITGTVTNCDGLPLTNGYLYVDGNHVQSITNGIINYSISHCSNVAVDLQIYDFDSNQWVIIENVLLNGGTVNINTQSTCDNTGGVFNGNISLTSQQEINEFGQFDYTRINGNLSISESDTTNSPITDLSPLSSINRIDGYLSIGNNDNLQNLDGLENLRTVEYISIYDHEELTSLSALSGLINVEALKIYRNSSLTSFESLENMTANIEWLLIEENSNLTSLTGLQNATITQNFYVEANHSLTNLSGITLSESINWVQIIDNDGLVDLTGINGINRIDYLFIGGNDALERLDGLENLIENRGIHIGFYIQTDVIAALGNNALNDLCALQNLFVNGSFMTTTGGFNGIFIEHNLFNPTYTEIANGNCSL
jgi:hypothetical protein